MERIRGVRDDLAQLEKFAVLARVHFGPDTEKALLAVLRVYDDIIMAARMLIMSAKDDAAEVADLRRKWNQTASLGHDEDDIAKAMNAAIADAERVLGPALTP